MHNRTKGPHMHVTPTTSVTPPAVVQPATSATSQPSQDGDLLAELRPSMDAAHRVGTPTTAGDAAEILSVQGDFVRGARASIERLDAMIDERRTRLADPQTSPLQQAEDQEQLQLMQVLRDRIQLSMERAARLFADDSNASMAAASLAPAPAALARAWHPAVERAAGAYRAAAPADPR